MAQPHVLSELYGKYEKWKSPLAALGLIAQGTVRPRQITRPDPADRRRKKVYGPYFQWTLKKQGRTVTVNLTRPQARAFQKAIANQRKLEKILLPMRALSLEILTLSTVGVAQRAKRSNVHRP